MRARPRARRRPNSTSALLAKSPISHLHSATPPEIGSAKVSMRNTYAAVNPMSPETGKKDPPQTGGSLRLTRSQSPSTMWPLRLTCPLWPVDRCRTVGEVHFTWKRYTYPVPLCPHSQAGQVCAEQGKRRSRWGSSRQGRGHEVEPCTWHGLGPAGGGGQAPGGTPSSLCYYSRTHFFRVSCSTQGPLAAMIFRYAAGRVLGREDALPAGSSLRWREPVRESEVGLPVLSDVSSGRSEAPGGKEAGREDCRRLGPPQSEVVA
jgi:hypothetical protein